MAGDSVVDLISGEDFDGAKWHLQSFGVDTKFKWEKVEYTPLMYACQFSSFDMVQLIIDCGANIELVTRKFEDDGTRSLVNPLICTILGGLDCNTPQDQILKLLRLKFYNVQISRLAFDTALRLVCTNKKNGCLSVMLKILSEEFEYDVGLEVAARCDSKDELAIHALLCLYNSAIYEYFDTRISHGHAKMILPMLVDRDLRKFYTYPLAKRCGRLEDAMVTMIYEDDIDNAKELVRKGYQLEGYDSHGTTLLSKMCFRKDVRGVKALLELNADPNTALKCNMSANGYPKTALEATIISLKDVGRADPLTQDTPENVLNIANMLMQNGAHVKGCLPCAIDYKRTTVVEALLSKWFHLFEPGTLYNETNIELDCLCDALNGSHESPSLSNQLKNLSLVDFEISKSFNPNIAISKTNYKSWIQNLPSRTKSLMLSVCCFTEESERCNDSQIISKTNPELSLLLKTRRVEMTRLLLKSNVSPNTPTSTCKVLNNPLCLAIHAGHKEIVRMLLSKKPNLNAKCSVDFLSVDNTPVLTACLVECEYSLREMRKIGLDMDTPLQDRHCSALAHVAMFRANSSLKWRISASRLLLECGADPFTPFKALNTASSDQMNTLFSVYDALQTAFKPTLIDLLVRGLDYCHGEVLAKMNSEVGIRNASFKCAKAAVVSVLKGVRLEQDKKALEWETMRRNAKDMERVALKWTRVFDKHLVTWRGVIAELKSAKRALEATRLKEFEKQAEADRRCRIKDRKLWLERITALRKVNREKALKVKEIIMAREAAAKRRAIACASRSNRPPRIKPLTASNMSRLIVDCAKTLQAEEDGDDSVDVQSEGGLSEMSLAVSVATVDFHTPVPMPHYKYRINSRFEEEVLKNDTDVTYLQQHCLKYGDRFETFDGRILHQGNSGFTMITDKTSTYGITAYRAHRPFQSPSHKIRCRDDGYCRVLGCKFMHTQSVHF